ncbi:ribokinase [Staphylococcus chromogenes]|uniref:ribokinase n=1 Tax=Staphylococcus chromogenes TaxID=46126 RepID=UPI000D1A47F4|nr:ribokinase [Staphylococcus chromogenes]PTG04831.1 ribokinase [Staphylococcus chromogenes]PTG54085.1 ribokinase [Staphylococcus chromogenes]
MKKIYVIGSVSMDLVVETNVVPQKGETVLGESFFTAPGGKGANQAVAAARLGENVHMIGRIGDDDFGQEIVQNFQRNGVDVTHLKVVPNMPSGTAHITLADHDNSIIVVPSANHEVTYANIKAQLAELQSCDIVLIQQEIPAETVEQVLAYCHQHHITSILNPAPYREVSDAVIAHADYITPNETESEALFKGDLEKALERYPNKLIVTIGDKGARYFNGEDHITVKGYTREVKDTTGAGDTFNGALAVGLQKEWPLEKAIALANLAASVSVTGMGAQGGMPTWDEIRGELDV